MTFVGTAWLHWEKVAQTFHYQVTGALVVVAAVYLAKSKIVTRD